MTRKLLAAAALCLALCTTGCGKWQLIGPNLDPNKSYYDSGSVVNNTGGSNCSLEIVTDHYGIVYAGPLDYDLCRAGHIGAHVFLEIDGMYNVRIIRIAP
ncbi:hypothetical protein KGO95_01910 [Patescibacteria group bacterium]|nr:hypothetical protein [Patescibacteria group bacterium]